MNIIKGESLTGAVRPWIGEPSDSSRFRQSPRSKQALRLKLYFTLLLLDYACIIAGFLLANAFRFGDPTAASGINMSAVLLPIYAGIALNSNAYGIQVLRRPREGICRALLAFLFTVGAVLFVAFYLRASGDFSRMVFGIGSVTTAALMIVGRLAFAGYATRKIGGNPLSEVVIVDGVPFENVPGVVTLDAYLHDLRPNIADPMMVARLGGYLENVDRVIVACAPERRQLWATLLKGANIHGEVLAPEFDDVGAIGTRRFESRATMAVSCGPLDLRSRALKRALDLSVALTALVVVLPLLLITALAIKLDSKGPVFFLQQRLGRGNRLFSMIKFRSMRTDLCDANGNQSTQRDDDRITPVGRFIRSTSIDELPQLLNVIAGDMSLVGPRPHALGSLAGSQLFWEVDQRYWHRHASKPGITGLAQIRGYRGATHESVDLSNRLHADLEYLAGWTIWRDISILFATFRVLVHRNAY